MEKVRVAAVGLGGRGQSVLDGLLLGMDTLRVTVVCDLYEDRVACGAASVERAYGERPFATTDWHAALDPERVDAVLIMSAWESHFPIAYEAMEKGIAVGMEVGGAYTVEDCWRLVRTQERTGTPFMLLENCCYGQMEMMVMHMVKEGLFGEVVHCSGGYCHDLRSEVARGEENRHYRLRNYLSRNCENYPTHELGPIAQVLGINRGNRMLSLVSMSTKAAGLNDYAARHPEINPALATAHFNQGDVVSTLIRCAGGQTISLTPARTAADLPCTAPALCTRRIITRCIWTATLPRRITSTGHRTGTTRPNTWKNISTRSGVTTWKTVSAAGTAAWTDWSMMPSSRRCARANRAPSTSTTPPHGCASHRCPSSPSQWEAHRFRYPTSRRAHGARGADAATYHSTPLATHTT